MASSHDHVLLTTSTRRISRRTLAIVAAVCFGLACFMNQVLRTACSVTIDSAAFAKATAVNNMPMHIVNDNDGEYETSSERSATGEANSSMGCPPEADGGPCLITAVSNDGFGHQLEAKLSCMAAGMVLSDLEYVHQPIHRIEHVGEPLKEANELENLFQLGKCVKNKDATMVGSFAGKSIQLLEWYKKMAAGQTTCQPNTVYQVDNCWDFMYASEHNVKYYYKAMPYFHEGLRASLSKPNVSLDFPVNRTNVAVHIRGGDRAGLVPMAFYDTCVNILRKQYLPSRGGCCPVYVQIHTNAEGSSLAEIKNKFVNQDDVEIVDAASVTLASAIVRMIESDVFVASRSSLSNAISLYRPARKRTIHPDCEKVKFKGAKGYTYRTLPHFEVWPCEGHVLKFPVWNGSKELMDLWS